MPVLFNPFYFSIDGNGVPRAGATYSFFQTGTSTPQNTYTDVTLASPNANPVVADSNGLFPPIYLSAAFDYKAILKDANGVTIATRDPLGFVPAMSLGVVPSYLQGLTLSAAGGTGTFGVAAGTAADSTNLAMMTLSLAVTKTTAAWAVGSGGGSLDTGSIAASTWYHAHEIRRPDIGVVDILISLSATSPTLPTNYTTFRRIGSLLTDGSKHWIAFVQVGDEFIWSASVGDVSTTLTATPSTLTLASVPTGVITWARFRAGAAGGSTSGVVFYPTDQAAQTFNTPAGNISADWLGNFQVGGEFMVRTNTSAQIMAVGTASGTNLAIATFGWIDRRGRD